MESSFIIVFIAAIPVYFVINVLENRKYKAKGKSNLHQNANLIGLRGQLNRTSVTKAAAVGLATASTAATTAAVGADYAHDDYINELTEQQALDAANPYLTPGVDAGIDESVHGHDRGLGIVNPDHDHVDAGGGFDAGGGHDW